MSEGLFILTLIFVAYVVYVIVGDSNTKKSSAKPKTTPKKSAASAAKPVVKKPAKTTPAKAKPKKAPSQAKAAIAESSASKDIRNPKTGEVAAIPANYRFAKRWIKEALVEEGLVEKIYKNTEIDEAATLKIKSALDTIRTIKKYQA